MPTKKRHHKNNTLDFELPPTQLSAHTNLSTTKTRKHKKHLSQRTRTNGSASTAGAYLEDDTPKAFTRLMTLKRKRGGDEDTGESRKKKGKKGLNPTSAGAPPREQKPPPPKNNTTPTILPGESLRAFNRRVDASMPVPLKVKREGKPAGKGAPNPNPNTTPGANDGEEEEEEEEQDYSDYLTDSSDAYSIDSTTGDPRPKTFHPRSRPRPRPIAAGKKSKSKSKSKAKKQRGPSPDPFAVLAEKRGGRVPFGETAAAPPMLTRPREVLKMRGVGGGAGGGGGGGEGGGEGGGVAEVPRAAGSLARREMLAGERRGVVERYREMMEGRRAVGGREW